MRIAMVCHEKTYENLRDIVAAVSENMSPPLKKWNETIQWVESGADLIVVETSMPFADTISSLPVPKAIYRGDIQAFKEQFARTVIDVEETLANRQSEKKQSYKENGIEEGMSFNKEELFMIDGLEQNKASGAVNAAQSLTVRKKPELKRSESKKEMKKDVPDFFGKDSKEKGVKGWFPKELKRAQKRATTYSLNHWSHIPYRLVIYAPKGSRHSATLSWKIVQLAGTNGALAEITHPYSELAALFQSIPPVTLMPPDEKTGPGNPLWEMDGIPIISSPVIYPVHQPWDVEVVKDWLKTIEDLMRGRMIVLHLGSQMPIPILKEVMAWSSANIWVMQDTTIDLGMADIQIETLMRQNMTMERSVLLVEALEGNKLPWKNVLNIPVLSKLTMEKESLQETINRIGIWLIKAAKCGPSLARKGV